MGMLPPPLIWILAKILESSSSFLIASCKCLGDTCFIFLLVQMSPASWRISCMRYWRTAEAKTGPADPILSAMRFCFIMRLHLPTWNRSPALSALEVTFLATALAALFLGIFEVDLKFEFPC